MSKEQRLDDKIFEGLELSRINSSEIKKHKIYDGTYFTKTSEIKTALQELLSSINASKEYSGKDIKNIIRQLYERI